MLPTEILLCAIFVEAVACGLVSAQFSPVLASFCPAYTHAPLLLSPSFPPHRSSHIAALSLSSHSWVLCELNRMNNTIRKQGFQPKWWEGKSLDSLWQERKEGKRLSSHLHFSFLPVNCHAFAVRVKL